jgi:hypothetical protein
MAVSFKMMSKWSSEVVVKFLDVYEDFEGIWNIRHSDYNNKIKRDSAMLKLMGELKGMWLLKVWRFYGRR